MDPIIWLGLKLNNKPCLLFIFIILIAVDKHQSVILFLLVISAAFDTINHDLLLSRLKCCFGICGKALDWFSSYLSGRRQFVKVNDMSSTYYIIEQGSVLGPILYSPYIHGIFKVTVFLFIVIQTILGFILPLI